MTLGTNEHVYQSDYMSVSPTADASIYSLIGDQIITGLAVTANSTGVTVTAGRALLQGRLLEISQTTTYSWPNGVINGYIGLIVNLGATNIQNQDGTITNNQYTVGIFTTITGNLLTGSTVANIPLCAVSNTGASSRTKSWLDNIVNGYSMLAPQVINDSSLLNNFETRDGLAVKVRVVNGITYISGAIGVKSGSTIAVGESLVAFVLPEYARPKESRFVSLNDGVWTMSGQITPLGEVIIGPFAVGGTVSQIGSRERISVNTSFMIG